MKEPPKQHNRRDLSSGCLQATCQAQSTLIMQLAIVVAGLSAMSDISQGSVMTPMWCSGIFNVNVTTNFLLISSVKECCKSVNIWWSYWHKKKLCAIFLSHPVCFMYASSCKRGITHEIQTWLDHSDDRCRISRSCLHSLHVSQLSAGGICNVWL